MSGNDDFSLDSLANAFKEADMNETEEVSKELVAQGITSGEQLLEIDDSDIEFDPNQPRKEIAEGWIEELADAIYKNGLQQFPVIEAHDGARPFVLRIGECRIRAWRLIRELHPEDERFQRIPVIRREYKERDGLPKIAVVRLGQIIENAKRENPPIMDEAIAIFELTKLIGRKRVTEELSASRQRKVSESWVSKRIALAKCDEQVIGDCNTNDIDDIESRILLNRIYEKDQEEYYTFIFKVQEGKIVKIRDAAAKLWKELNDGDKKPIKQEQSTGHSGVGSVVDSLPSEASDFDDKGKGKDSFVPSESDDTKADLVQENSAGNDTQVEEKHEEVSHPTPDVIVKVQRLINGNGQVSLIAEDGTVYLMEIPQGLRLVCDEEQGDKQND